MLCACIEGTVWFDYLNRKWKSSDHKCAKPEPRHPVVRPGDSPEATQGRTSEQPTGRKARSRRQESP